MEMRPLRESDHRVIVPVVDEWWGERRVSEKLPRLFFRYFGDTSFVVEEDVALLGFLVGFVSQSNEGEAYIHFVGVNPEHRGRGIGRGLYEAFFERARRRGRRRIRCITSPVNRGSIAFHERLGFGIEAGDGESGGVSVHVDYDRDGKDKVVFVKTLGV